MIKNLELNAILCHHVRQNRSVRIKLINNKFQIVQADCIEATFDIINYYNNNKAYWLTIIE